MSEGEGEDLSPAPSPRCFRGCVIKEEGHLPSLTALNERNFTQGLGEGKKEYSNTPSSFEGKYGSYGGLFLLTLSSP